MSFNKARFASLSFTFWIISFLGSTKMIFTDNTQRIAYGLGNLTAVLVTALVIELLIQAIGYVFRLVFKKK